VFDSGSLVVEERTYNNAWDQLYLNGSMDVIIVQDDEFDIRIETGARKLEYIDTKVVDNQLIISERHNNVLNDKQTKVWISKSVIHSIQLNGSGDIRGTGLIADYLDVDISGSGNIELNANISDYIVLNVGGSGDALLEGVCDLLTLYVNGSGDVDSRNLPVGDCAVFVNGSGDSRVNVSGELQVNINGSGDVYYWGQPTYVYVNNNGSGEVYSMN